METTNVQHRWEAGGIGKAPFKVLHYEYKTFQACIGARLQCGGTCAICSSPICNIFHVQDATGKIFLVGPDCVMKAGDKGLIDSVKRKMNQIKREAKHVADLARIRAAVGFFEANRGVFEALPHPKGFAGQTLADQVDWMWRNAGMSGRVATARLVEKTLNVTRAK